MPNVQVQVLHLWQVLMRMETLSTNQSDPGQGYSDVRFPEFVSSYILYLSDKFIRIVQNFCFQKIALARNSKY